jgi:hypothetical protein
MRRYVILATLVILGAQLTSCSKRVVEWDVRLGERTDRRTNYYAYTTGLGARNVSAVQMRLASRSKIERRLVFQSDSAQAVYPRVAYDPTRAYILPDVLAELLPDLSRQTAQQGDTLSLGYFMMDVPVDPLESRDLFDSKRERGATKGVEWVRLRDAAKPKIKLALAAIRDRAALEGADAVVDISVFWSDKNLPFGGAALYLTGRSIAIGKIRRE